MAERSGEVSNPGTQDQERGVRAKSPSRRSLEEKPTKQISHEDDPTVVTVGEVPDGRAAAEARDEAAVELAEAQVKADQAGHEAVAASAEEVQNTASDARFAETVDNPNPNPYGLEPPPGPSLIQYRGVPDEEA